MAAVSSAGRASGLEPLELAAGSDVAAAALYERNVGRVFGYCLSRLGRREDAEDAVQTTFLHAVRALKAGVVPLVEPAWLLGIARNVCLARWESAGRRSRLETVCDPVVLADAEAAPDEARDELVGIEDALARLPEQQRRAVLLRDWRGLSYDETAQHLGVSRACVESLIFRGRRSLAAALRDRIASLGNLGSVAAALKTLLAGGAAAKATAVAVAVTAGAGFTVAGLDERTRPAPRPAASTDIAPAATAFTGHERARPTRPEPARPAPASRRVPVSRRASPAPAAGTKVETRAAPAPAPAPQRPAPSSRTAAPLSPARSPLTRPLPPAPAQLPELPSPPAQLPGEVAAAATTVAAPVDGAVDAATAAVGDAVAAVPAAAEELVPVAPAPVPVPPVPAPPLPVDPPTLPVDPPELLP